MAQDGPETKPQAREQPARTLEMLRPELTKAPTHRIPVLRFGSQARMAECGA